MRKIIYLLAGIIVISNVIWGSVFLTRNSSQAESIKDVQIYTLKGTGRLWEAADYKVIISPAKIMRGHGSLAYKGDPKEIENSTYYKIEIQELNPNGHYESVYVNEASSHGGPINILSNLNDIGSITGDYADNERLKDRHNYGSSVLTITWNDNDGELHSETINLNMAAEIILSED
ncbi:hypothetical protein [Paenibacillus senegalensis]|uniref:hypothetical protein n=1 Tax=Paenibacillus senegalensis TaxID=1465766 RepID=UPI0002894790|nr:hypothetical protein [Paenibacillus senegalensis]